MKTAVASFPLAKASGTVTEVRFAQPWKAFDFISATDFPVLPSAVNVTEETPLLRYALLPIVTPFAFDMVEKSAAVKLSVPSNALLPIVVTDDGKTNCLSDVQFRNALLSTVVSAAFAPAIVKVVRAVQFSKALEPILVTLSPITTSFPI